MDELDKSIGIELIDSDFNDVSDNSIAISGDNAVGISLKNSLENKLKRNNILITKEINTVIDLINKQDDDSINPKTGNSYKNDILHILEDVKKGGSKPSWLENMSLLTTTIANVLSLPGSISASMSVIYGLISGV